MRMKADVKGMNKMHQNHSYTKKPLEIIESSSNEINDISKSAAIGESKCSLSAAL